ncbi:MAG: hypothetical protein M1818_004130 [Claussenomyces sp. TS43310]|nr:MAG: hypothetical protein M1818_004130 [Claussenomyces sp. TS43310]
MAPLLEDPRIRQTWNHISYNAGTATENAATGLWTFTHRYINPCFTSISSAFGRCTGSCCNDREERARRLRERGRTRGRAEYSFDFYDDWDEDNEGGGSGGLLGWGNDELDRLLAGGGGHSDQQPSGRKRRMSYGTKGGRRRQKTIDGLPDPTIIPSTNSLGFLQRLPWKFGGTLRYKPSAADLQEHPGLHRADLGEESEPLINDDERSSEGDGDLTAGNARKRSSTAGSGETTDSFRSRGDLFPSDGEDDAVPLGDEFAMVLERRMTGLSGHDDRSSGKSRSSKGKKMAGPRTMSRTASGATQSSDNNPSPLGKTQESTAFKVQPSDLLSTDAVGSPTITDLEEEEERLRKDEEADMERKRQAAANLARERGLSVDEMPSTRTKQEAPAIEDTRAILYTNAEAEQKEEPTPVIDSERSTEITKSNDGDFVPARLPKF